MQPATLDTVRSHEPMLGVTSYQDALRAVGGWLDRERKQSSHAGAGQESPQAATLPAQLVLEEEPAQARLRLSLEGNARTVDAARLEGIVLESRARRGADGSASGPLSDLLRAVGFALDDLSAGSVYVEVKPEAMAVRFRGRRDGQPHEMTYAGDELVALRRAAAARRKGDPLSRVLILHQDFAASASIRELLVAEFAVEDLPTMYAPAVAQSNHPPQMIMLHVGEHGDSASALDTVRLLRASPHTASTPVIVVAAPGSALDPAEVFEVGANDFLQEPIAPALIRARTRTWSLRNNGSRPATLTRISL